MNATNTNSEIRLDASWRKRFARAQVAATSAMYKAQEMIDLPQCMVSGTLVGPLMRHCSIMQGAMDMLLAELDGRFRQPMVPGVEPAATLVRDELKHEEELLEHLYAAEELADRIRARGYAGGDNVGVPSRIMEHMVACRKLLLPTEAVEPEPEPEATLVRDEVVHEEKLLGYLNEIDQLADKIAGLPSALGICAINASHISRLTEECRQLLHPPGGR